MIQRIFITIGVLLAISFLGCIYYFNRPAPVPLPELTPSGIAVPKASPEAADTTPADYSAILRAVSLAARRYQETHLHPVQADRSQQDGGLKSLLLMPNGTTIPNSSSVFWRLVTGNGTVVLCAQFLNPSEGLELTTSIAEAARTNRLPVDAQVCGDSAIGIHITAEGVAPSNAEALPPPGLPGLPGLPSLPALPGAPAPTSAVAPAAGPNADHCEADQAIDERLSRLL